MLVSRQFCANLNRVVEAFDQVTVMVERKRIDTHTHMLLKPAKKNAQVLAK
jgi:hypothetical protein